jgi:hypothetical protein
MAKISQARRNRRNVAAGTPRRSRLLLRVAAPQTVDPAREEAGNPTTAVGALHAGLPVQRTAIRRAVSVTVACAVTAPKACRTWAAASGAGHSILQAGGRGGTSSIQLADAATAAEAAVAGAAATRTRRAIDSAAVPLLTGRNATHALSATRSTVGRIGAQVPAEGLGSNAAPGECRGTDALAPLLSPSGAADGAVAARRALRLTRRANPLGWIAALTPIALFATLTTPITRGAAGTGKTVIPGPEQYQQAGAASGPKRLEQGAPTRGCRFCKAVEPLGFHGMIPRAATHACCRDNRPGSGSGRPWP